MSHLQAPLSRSSLVPFKVLYETAQKRGIVGNNKYMVHDGGNGKNSAISLASENKNMMHFDGSKETERIHYRENEQANVLNQLGLEISVERH